MRNITEYEYLEATNSYLGWCTTCEEFTRDCCEPDAHQYDCPECRENHVYGAEEALLQGFIYIREED